MIRLSGVVIAYNEEQNIARCLDSLKGVVDEIIVVDSFSTDKTKAICSKLNVTFIEQEFLGYGKQKNFALQQANFDHVVSLDADEYLSIELADSINQLKSSWDKDGYYCNRLNFFCGQWIKYSDWYPNKKLRVFNRKKAQWDNEEIHENVIFNSKNPNIGHLKGDILHHTYQSYSEFNSKTEYFSSISANAYFKKGKSSPMWKILLNPAWAFFKSYFLRLGFLDGFNGLMIAYQTANITFLKYSKLRELIKTHR